MGLLIEGTWHDQWYDTDKHSGRFERSESQFRHWVTPDGSPGPSGGVGFVAETDRYHLVVSLACPWAHRTLIFRRLKGLENLVSVSVVHPLMLENGWTFDRDFPATTGDILYGNDFLYQLYLMADPNYSGRVTVPILWDKQRRTIVSNESADIIRIFNTAFDGMGAHDGDYYPADLQPIIDDINERVYHKINNGVYKSGFATSQLAYDEAVTELFDALEWANEKLTQSRYLVGSRLTEADWRLFTTLVRFDAVYTTHFKCDLKRIADYPALTGFMRELYQMPGIAETLDFAHIRHHYFRSHGNINPNGIISIGPEPDFHLPHDREKLTMEH